MLDLKNASRDELIRVVLAQRDAIVALERQGTHQRDVIARLEAAVAEVTRQLGAARQALPSPTPPAADPAAEASPPKRMPGTKPTQAPQRPKQPRTRRAHGYGRRRLAAGARLRPPPAGADRPPGACGGAVPGLRPPAGRGHDQAHARGD
jgi:uncharacterized coiled-coil protein SlyX